ncbi:MAG: FAD-binding oxidoreductase [Planctomycetes bacterium]|nr:FAD-binding oxidoreductase [Planctomycetota bacterium]
MDCTPRSPELLWERTASPSRVFARLEGEHEAAVLVVGGDYGGLSTALHLAELGVRVALLEAEDVGHGGSGRNNGQIIPHHASHAPTEIEQRFGVERGRRLNRFVRDAAAYTFDLIRRHGIECDAVQNGWVQPAHVGSKLARSRLLAE